MLSLIYPEVQSSACLWLTGKVQLAVDEESITQNALWPELTPVPAGRGSGGLQGRAWLANAHAYARMPVDRSTTSGVIGWELRRECWSYVIKLYLPLNDLWPRLGPNTPWGLLGVMMVIFNVGFGLNLSWLTDLEIRGVFYGSSSIVLLL